MWCGVVWYCIYIHIYIRTYLAKSPLVLNVVNLFVTRRASCVLFCFVSFCVVLVSVFMGIDRGEGYNNGRID